MIVPYVEVNGAWTLSNDQVTEAYDQTVKDGTHVHIFYGGTIKSGDDFLGLMRNPSYFPCFVFDDDQMVGFAFLSDITDKAFGHFNFFKKSWGKSVDYGNEVIDYWFSLTQNGNPALQVILGTTPSYNRKALSFIQKLGFTLVGEIPNLIYNAYSGRREAAYISYKTR